MAFFNIEHTKCIIGKMDNNYMQNAYVTKFLDLDKTLSNIKTNKSL